MSDEESPLAKKQRTNDPQPNSIMGTYYGGQQFEIKMAALIGLRGMERGDNFELATNVRDAGNFDDLVYTVGSRRYCLQLKHTHNPGTNKLVQSEMVSLLHKCFESYCSIIQQPKFEKIKHDRLQFIIYTNKQLGPKLFKHKTKEVLLRDCTIFKTSDQGKIFKFIPDNNKEKDVYTLVEESPKKNNNDNRKNKSKLKKIKEFLNKLIIFTGQKDQWKLNELITDEIRNHDAIKVDREEYNSVLLHFKPRVENWWRKRNEKMTPQTLRDWLKKAKTESCNSVVRCLYHSCNQGFGKTRIKFSNEEISELQDELSKKRAVHMTSDALALCNKLLLDCLPQSKCIFVTYESQQSNINLLLHAWLGCNWEWLTVFCDSTVRQSDISSLCSDISDTIKHDHWTKRVIILTACSVQQITGFDPVEQKFVFEQLSKESQEVVLDKQIEFQGCEVTLRSVLQQHGNVQHVLGPELVTDLITAGTTVNIGGRLQENTDHYAPRVFKRKIWLPLNILMNRNTYPDIFAVSGIETSGLVDKVPSDEEVGYFYFDEDTLTENSTQNYDVVGKRFIVLKGRNLKSSFLKLREIHKRETLHWLKYKDETLLWKETRGNIYNLLNCIDAEITPATKGIIAECLKSGNCEVNEESIWDRSQKTVLVVAEPGMGKSSTTTQVAWNTKKADPNSWVVRINWNDHTGKLHQINAATFNFDSLVEFLCSAAFTESKYSDINRNLLKQALQNSGNVTVLMDGFDEISPTHADKAAVIVSELMKTNVGRVWVTSRLAQRERLEKELSVIAFGMKKLSHTSQRAILMDIWLPKATGDKGREYLVRYTERLLMLACDLNQYRNFTGTPLYVTMIASALEMDVETHLISRDFNDLPKINLLYLYDRIVEMQIHIQERQTKWKGLTNASVKDGNEMLKEISGENLEKCSLLVTLPSELNPLRREEIQKIQKFLKRVQAGKDNIGIVMSVVENSPHFVHRTFAEYFTARWFSKNIISNRSLLERILFDSSYGIVRDVFDRILARGYPLHCAVLNRDILAVGTLLNGRSDVNAVDKGGRTALHLIAAEGPGDYVCEKITSSLLRHEASVNTEDLVLQWRPLKYARQTGNTIVEKLLSG